MRDGIGNICDENDERFFEENKYILYLFGGIIAIIFLVIAMVILKRKD